MAMNGGMNPMAMGMNQMAQRPMGMANMNNMGMANKPMGGMNNMGMGSMGNSNMNTMGISGMGGMNSMNKSRNPMSNFGGMGGGNKNVMADPLASLSMSMGGMNTTPMPAKKSTVASGVMTTNQELFSDFKIQ